MITHAASSMGTDDHKTYVGLLETGSHDLYLSASSMGTTLSTVPSPVVSSAIESGTLSGSRFGQGG